MKIVNVEGVLAVQDQEDQLVFDPRKGATGDGGGGTRPQPKPPPKEETGKPKEIELGPLPRPPLPISVYVMTKAGAKPKLGSGPFVLRLDTDVDEEGWFRKTTIDALRSAAATAPKSVAVGVCVYLPKSRVVDVDVLRAHLTAVQQYVGHDLDVQVAGTVPEK